MLELPKNKKSYDKATFNQLYNLIKDNYWLEDNCAGLYYLWDENEKKSERELLECLLRRFTCLSSREMNKYCKLIVDNIVIKWKINSSNTKIVAICDEKDPDGSQFILQFIKNKFADYDGWSSDNFRNSLLTIGKVPYQLRKNQTIILIDDFIGSGKTINRKVNWLKDQITEKKKQGVKLYLTSLASMKVSLNVINDLDIPFYSPIILEKAITDYYDEHEEKIKIMQQIENKLANKNRGEILPRMGFKQSESIFTIEGVNIPNNVFPTFWWSLAKDHSKRQTIFKRLR